MAKQITHTLSNGTKLTDNMVKNLSYIHATEKVEWNFVSGNVVTALKLRGMITEDYSVGGKYYLNITPAGTAALTELGLITPAAPEAPAPAVDTFGQGNFEVGQRVEMRFKNHTEFGIVQGYTERHFQRIVRPDAPAYEGQTYTMNVKDLREVDDTARTLNAIIASDTSLQDLFAGVEPDDTDMLCDQPQPAFEIRSIRSNGFWAFFAGTEVATLIGGHTLENCKSRLEARYPGCIIITHTANLDGEQVTIEAPTVSDEFRQRIADFKKQSSESESEIREKAAMEWLRERARGLAAQRAFDSGMEYDQPQPLKLNAFMRQYIVTKNFNSLVIELEFDGYGHEQSQQIATVLIGTWHEDTADLTGEQVTITAPVWDFNAPFVGIAEVVKAIDGAGEIAYFNNARDTFYVYREANDFDELFSTRFPSLFYDHINFLVTKWRKLPTNSGASYRPPQPAPANLTATVITVTETPERITDTFPVVEDTSDDTSAVQKLFAKLGITLYSGMIHEHGKSFTGFMREADVDKLVGQVDFVTKQRFFPRKTGGGSYQTGVTFTIPDDTTEIRMWHPLAKTPDALKAELKEVEMAQEVDVWEKARQLKAAGQGFSVRMALRKISTQERDAAIDELYVELLARQAAEADLKAKGE